MDINNTIENLGTYTIDQFFKLWESQKDVFIIKYDGLRETNKYTVLLLAFENRFDTIRIECEEILCGIEDALNQYKEMLNRLENINDMPI